MVFGVLYFAQLPINRPQDPHNPHITCPQQYEKPARELQGMEGRGWHDKRLKIVNSQHQSAFSVRPPQNPMGPIGHFFSYIELFAYRFFQQGYPFFLRVFLYFDRSSLYFKNMQYIAHLAKYATYCT